MNSVVKVSYVRGCELHKDVQTIPFDFKYGSCGAFNLGTLVALLCVYYNSWNTCWR